jgi:hypothetical protein
MFLKSLCREKRVLHYTTRKRLLFIWYLSKNNNHPPNPLEEQCAARIKEEPQENKSLLFKKIRMCSHIVLCQLVHDYRCFGGAQL